MAKSNVQYLYDLIKDNDEAVEFLNAIEEELKEANDGWDEAIKSRKNEEDRADSLERELNEIKDSGPGNIIRTPQGNIQWEADNLQHMAIFEAIEEKIKTASPLQIEAAINDL